MQDQNGRTSDSTPDSFSVSKTLVPSRLPHELSVTMVDFKQREFQRFNPEVPENHTGKGTVNVTVRTGKSFRGDKYHRLSDLKTGRVLVSWNRFARSLKEAFELYFETKQAELYARLEDIPRRIKLVPFRKIFVISMPFLCYFMLYFNYGLFRTITGLGKVKIPNYTFLPWLELLIFHCYPHQILAQFAHPVLDIVAAVPYLVHFPLPALFALYKIASSQNAQGVFPFVWCAGWVNLLSTMVQFLFPTAPPWYADSVVFAPNGNILKYAANEAGFHRLDAMLGVKFFHNLYSASPLKYGAMPSLHVAWPAIILVSGPWISERFAMFHVAWITWAALYSNHHYGVDAIAGIFLVFLVNFLMRKVWCPFPMENGKKPCCSLCLKLFKGRPPPLLEV